MLLLVAIAVKKYGSLGDDLLASEALEKLWNKHLCNASKIDIWKFRREKVWQSHIHDILVANEENLLSLFRDGKQTNRMTLESFKTLIFKANVPIEDKYFMEC